MTQLILQAQLLLAALSVILPLAPAEHRARIADILELAAKAIAAGAAVSANLQEASAKLAAVRRELEALAASGRPLGADDIDRVIARVRAASADFRAALAEEA